MKLQKEIERLGVTRRNAYRIAHESKGHAAKALVKLIAAIHANGLTVSELLK